VAVVAVAAAVATQGNKRRGGDAEMKTSCPNRKSTVQHHLLESIPMLVEHVGTYYSAIIPSQRLLSLDYVD
jgi:hypothetical protein